MQGNIANTLKDLGKHQEALAMYQEALPVFEVTFGPEHPSVADTYYNIGWVLNSDGQYPEALEVCQKALDINIKIHGRNHLVVADTKVCHLNTWRYDHSVDDESLWAGEYGACL